jgi:hypothetical protein
MKCSFDSGMSQRSSTVLLAAGLFLAGAPLSAQTQIAPEDDALHFSVGGGFSAPGADVRQALGGGYHIAFGVQYDLTRFVSIEGLASINDHGDTTLQIPVTPTPGVPAVPTDFLVSMTTELITGNVMVQVPDGAVRPYAAVGLGIYDRPVRLTTDGFGWLPAFCEPWLYVCHDTGFVPVETIDGERGSVDVGVDVGGGVNYRFMFFEARYHHIWGPTLRPAPAQGPGDAGIGRKVNGSLFAVTFGVRL